jgi:hypothetical protein
MNADERQALIDALAELLADWLTTHPERSPHDLRSERECGLVNRPQAKEQP